MGFFFVVVVLDMYQIFWEVVGLERGPLSLFSKIQELHEKK
jgi:hypothetical protein